MVIPIKSFLTFVILLIAVLITACSNDYQPKPKGYNRLLLPKAEYRPLPDSLPYQFDYSLHAKLLNDSSWMREKHWIEIYDPDLKANIHITYKRLEHSDKLLKEFYNDAYKLTSKHQIKAYAIDETITKTPHGKTAVIAEIEGEVPSQFQFTVTDSTTNFLRGALYFNVKVQNDSLKPAIEYMKREMMQLINTLEWREKPTLKAKAKG
jgi:gliding motility-associated lipoprotein GldD